MVVAQSRAPVGVAFSQGDDRVAGALEAYAPAVGAAREQDQGAPHQTRASNHATIRAPIVGSML